MKRVGRENMKGVEISLSLDHKHERGERQKQLGDLISSEHLLNISLEPRYSVQQGLTEAEKHTQDFLLNTCLDFCKNTKSLVLISHNVINLLHHFFNAHLISPENASSDSENVFLPDSFLHIHKHIFALVMRYYTQASKLFTTINMGI